jgi:hypothetical protein
LTIWVRSGEAAGSAPVELADDLDQLVDQGVLALAVDEHVVGGDAGLAGVEELAPRHAVGGDAEVGARGDDGRRLAPELEHGGREVLGRRLGHDLAHGGGAGEEDVVPALLEQLGGHLGAALEHGDGVGVEVLAEQAGQQPGGLRHQLGRLGHHGVAGGEGGCHRRHHQLHGVVPRSDDQRHAQRLGDDPALARHVLEAQPGLAGLHPLLDVLADELHLGGGERDVGRVRLERRLAEVALHGGHEVVAVLVEDPEQRVELALAPLDRTGPAALERVADGGDRARDRVEVGVGACVDAHGSTVSTPPQLATGVANPGSCRWAV